MKLAYGFPLLVCCPVLLLAQNASPAPAKPSGGATPVPYSSVSQVNLLLSQLEQSSQAMQRDLSDLKVEKWKTDAATKRSSQADIASIERNLQTALPAIVADLRDSPESLPPTFKLYRNLDALYDVFVSVTESAGAFGSRDEYQALQNDLGSLDGSRRMFADRMAALAESKEVELTKLRTDLQTARATEKVAPPPKKVIVDDTVPPSKPVKKRPAHKVPKAPAPPAPNPDATTPSTPPNTAPH